MNSPIVKVRDEGNCARVTEGGEEACECARKHRPVFAADRIHVQAARLRTETAYKAGSGKASEHNITKPFPDNRLGK